jgi:hypothetical protein
VTVPVTVKTMMDTWSLVAAKDFTVLENGRNKR